MIDAFYSLGLTKEQLTELHRSVLARYVIEDTFRRERGEETEEPPALLAHLERLLDLSSEEAHALFHEEEDRLWEYSWYAYTDEWAWYRARQEVERELGEQLSLTKPDKLEALIEATYEQHFARYAKEIDMASAVSSAASPKNSLPRRAKK
ncbi:hypothetical protein KBD34_02280 [Patescibacteria group bacterium]|nr:hypothetical protein [Patescibacteria group bacterium]